jgi:isopentenyldiphosphate isomerase
METFDVLDCAGRRTGELVSRDDAHRGRVWHGAFHCLVIYEREGGQYALFQKRAADKKIAPGKFDVSVGGHYSAGEDAAVAGPREIGEELGMEVKFQELVPLGRRVFVYCFTPGVTEYEFQDVFLLPGTVAPGELKLQKEEVEAVLEVELASGIGLFSGRENRVEGMLAKADGVPNKIGVTAGEFVPCLDNYYLKLLLLAKRYFEGERELLFI